MRWRTLSENSNYCLNHAHDAMVVKLYRPYIQFPRNVRPISSAHRDCSAIRYRDFLSVFDNAPYKYSYVLQLTDEFLVNKYLRHVENMREGLECYKDTQMKAYDVTKLTVELKSVDNIRYGNNTTLLVVSVSVATGSTYIR